ncbi:MAG: arsenate reductase (glutaredoxin) [Euryarchaeota archaeon]|nr:arsenate reductase (glutaredoxin) [Euryarchaeota archaeon]
MKLKIIHNPRCSKSRQAKNLLEERNISFETILYLSEYLSKTEIRKIVNNFSDSPILLVRIKEKLFKDLKIKKEMLNDKKYIIELLSKYPKLIERPLLLLENKTIIGRPPENFLEFI